MKPAQLADDGSGDQGDDQNDDGSGGDDQSDDPEHINLGNMSNPYS